MQFDCSRRLQEKTCKWRSRQIDRDGDRSRARDKTKDTIETWRRLINIISIIISEFRTQDNLLSMSLQGRGRGVEGHWTDGAAFPCTQSITGYGDNVTGAQQTAESGRAELQKPVERTQCQSEREGACLNATKILDMHLFLKARRDNEQTIAFHP